MDNPRHTFNHLQDAYPVVPVLVNSDNKIRVITQVLYLAFKKLTNLYFCRDEIRYIHP